MQRILFLDVDGPLIPSGMYVINRRASWERMCSPICVAIVNELCRKADAKIVFNSTHNRDGSRALADLAREGLDVDFFHEDAMTGYFQDLSVGTRMGAIEDWMEKNGEADWIAFDDSNFTDNERLILIPFEVGITPHHYHLASEIWKIEPIIVLG
jgi:hypothetical protein